MIGLLKLNKKKWVGWYTRHKFLVWLGLAVWLFLVIMTGKRSLTYFLVSNVEPDYTVFYMRGILVWTLALLFIPLIVKVADHCSLDERPYLKNFAVHILGSLVFLIILAALFTLLWSLRLSPSELTGVFLSELRSNLVWLSLLVPVSYWMIVGGYHLNKYYNKYKARRNRSVLLRSELKKMQHQVLQMQMHPHFLFNALNTVSAFISHNPKEAERMLEKIQTFLRISVKDDKHSEIPFREELGYVDAYLSIEQKRFSDRLVVKKDIDDQAQEVLVPRLLLQPLVENAIRHGISAKRDSGLLLLKAKVEEGKLHIYIEDDGKGFDEEKRNLSKGLGLKNTIQRLKMLYNTDYTFNIEPKSPSGTKVTLILPANNK